MAPRKKTPKKKAKATKKKVAAQSLPQLSKLSPNNRKKKTTKKSARTKAKPNPGPPAWRELYLSKLRETNSVTHAAEACGITRQAIYKYAKKNAEEDGDFADLCIDAKASSVDDLRQSMFQKAKTGWLEANYYKGKKIGSKNKFSPTLAMWMLSKLCPEEFNLPSHDPMRDRDNEKIGNNTEVLFYPDADEARKRAEDAVEDD